MSDINVFGRDVIDRLEGDLAEERAQHSFNVEQLQKQLEGLQRKHAKLQHYMGIEVKAHHTNRGIIRDRLAANRVLEARLTATEDVLDAWAKWVALRDSQALSPDRKEALAREAVEGYWNLKKDRAARVKP